MGEANDKQETRFFHVDSEAFSDFIDDQDYVLTNLEICGDNMHAIASRKPLVERFV